MILHPCVNDILERRAGVLKQLRDGSLQPDAVLPLLEGWAEVRKDRTLAFGRSGGAPEVLDEHTLLFTVTTSDEDRDGDIVVPLGYQGVNYARNPVCFFGHQEWAVPVATSRALDGRILVWPEENRVLQGMRFDEHDSDAMLIKDKCLRGFLNATSIAFVPIEAYRRGVEKADTHHGHEGGWHFKQWDHTETSIVGVPSNAGAVRDFYDSEKSHMSPKLRKAVLPFCEKARGRCFSGWCPSKSCGCKACVQGEECECKSNQADIEHGMQRKRAEVVEVTGDASKPMGDAYGGPGWYIFWDSGDVDGPYSEEEAKRRARSRKEDPKQKALDVSGVQHVREGDVLEPLELRKPLESDSRFLEYQRLHAVRRPTPREQDRMSKLSVQLTHEYGLELGQLMSRAERHKYIRRRGNKWVVYSRAGKVLGTHGTKHEALAQLRAIEANKAWHPQSTPVPEVKVGDYVDAGGGGGPQRVTNIVQDSEGHYRVYYASGRKSPELMHSDRLPVVEVPEGAKWCSQCAAVQEGDRCEYCGKPLVPVNKALDIPSLPSPDEERRQSELHRQSVFRNIQRWRKKRDALPLGKERERLTRYINKLETDYGFPVTKSVINRLKPPAGANPLLFASLAAAVAMGVLSLRVAASRLAKRSGKLKGDVEEALQDAAAKIRDRARELQARLEDMDVGDKRTVEGTPVRCISNGLLGKVFTLPDGRHLYSGAAAEALVGSRKQHTKQLVLKDKVRVTARRTTAQQLKPGDRIEYRGKVETVSGASTSEEKLVNIEFEGGDKASWRPADRISLVTGPGVEGRPEDADTGPRSTEGLGAAPKGQDEAALRSNPVFQKLPRLLKNDPVRANQLADKLAENFGMDAARVLELAAGKPKQSEIYSDPDFKQLVYHYAGVRRLNKDTVEQLSEKLSSKHSGATEQQIQDAAKRQAKKGLNTSSGSAGGYAVPTGSKLCRRCRGKGCRACRGTGYVAKVHESHEDARVWAEDFANAIRSSHFFPAYTGRYTTASEETPETVAVEVKYRGMPLDKARQLLERRAAKFAPDSIEFDEDRGSFVVTWEVERPPFHGEQFGPSTHPPRHHGPIESVDDPRAHRARPKPSSAYSSYYTPPPAEEHVPLHKPVHDIRCPECNGTGVGDVEGEVCLTCGGLGTVPEDETLKYYVYTEKGYVTRNGYTEDRSKALLFSYEKAEERADEEFGGIEKADHGTCPKCGGDMGTNGQCPKCQPQKAKPKEDVEEELVQDLEDDFSPKESGTVFAKLHKLAEAEKEFIEEASKVLDNKEAVEHLQEYMETMVEPRFEALENALHGLHGEDGADSEELMEKYKKGMESDGDTTMQTGEANLVDRGRIPQEPATQEILERYKGQDGKWYERSIGRVQTKDGKTYIVKDERADDYAEALGGSRDKRRLIEVLLEDGINLASQDAADAMVDEGWDPEDIAQVRAMAAVEEMGLTGAQEGVIMGMLLSGGVMDVAELEAEGIDAEQLQRLLQGDGGLGHIKQAGSYMESMAVDTSVPKQHRGPLRYHAKMLKQTYKALTNAGRQQRNGGKGKLLTDEGSAGWKRPLTDEGEREGKNPRMDKVVVSPGKLSEPDPSYNKDADELMLVKEFEALKQEYFWATGEEVN